VVSATVVGGSVLVVVVAYVLGSSFSSGKGGASVVDGVVVVVVFAVGRRLGFRFGLPVGGIRTGAELTGMMASGAVTG
jgi:hypothetical protein